MLFTFTASIGRSIGGGPEELDKNRWIAFREEFTILVSTFANHLYFRGTGVGTNPYADPVTHEESFTIVGDIFAHQREALLRNLEALAKPYGQKSIAVTFGETVFAGEEE